MTLAKLQAYLKRRQVTLTSGFGIVWEGNVRTGKLLDGGRSTYWAKLSEDETGRVLTTGTGANLASAVRSAILQLGAKRRAATPKARSRFGAR